MRHLLTALACVVLISAQARAESAWQDISAEVAKILDIPSLLNPWYIKKGSRKSVKSVELAGVTYESAEFSYTKVGDETTRRRFFVDCQTASYKDSLATRGNLAQMS